MTGTVLRVVTRLNRGGPLRQMTALVPGLERLGWRGPVAVGAVEPHERDGRNDLVEVGADLHDVPGLQRGIRPRADRRALKALRALIDRVAPDVVHTHLGKAGALARMAAAPSGTPVVHTFHGHHFARPGLVGWLARAAERRLAKHTAAWITLSKSQCDDVRAVVGPKAAQRIHVVAPGFDVASFAGLPEPDPTPVRVLWCGRHVPVKNVDYLLDAFEACDAPCMLTLLGGGPGLADVRARVRGSPRREHIVVQDEVDDPRTVLASHHVAVLSSQSEGTPLALLEGMAAGRTVVSTAVGGVRDIVEPERTGLLVPPGAPAATFANVLARAVGDVSLRSRLGRAAAVDVARRFGPERLAKETAAVYAAVLDAAKS